MDQAANKISSNEPTQLHRVLTIQPTAKVERLRESYLSLKPAASIDRARIETRVMKETEGKSTITRRAEVFAAIVRETPIDIYPDELVVGYAHVRPRSISIRPSPGLVGRLEGNVGAGRSGPEMAGFDMPDLDGLSDAEKRELKEELIPYWQKNSRTLRAGGYGHNIVAYDRVLRDGFLGIKEHAEERLAGLDLAEPDEAAKVPFLQGVVTAMAAASELGQRFATKARELAEKETDSVREAELLRIAEVCDQVPANPARTFHEAMQSCYFAWLLTMWENPHAGGQSVGRLDQYLYPYYARDLSAGRITVEGAQELIDCCLIKFNHSPPVAAITVGGVKADGNDATNELSYMLIEGMMHTRLGQPYFSVQVHSQMPDALLIKACQLTSLGCGHPEFINNDVLVGQALARGDSGGPPVTLEDARSAAPIGCLEMGIPGKDSGYLYFEQPNLAACLDRVMTNGLRRSDQEKVGVETGDPRQFKSFDAVRDAFHQQVAWMRRNIQINGNVREQSIIEFAPTLFESALIEGCIEKGMCRELGGAHYNFNIGGAALGSSDAGDSLTAIKKLVFDDRSITMDQLCDALDNNFEGHDDILKSCLEAPKFGNDDDYADEEVAWVLHEWVTEFTKLKNMRGGSGSPGGSVMGSYAPAGRQVGALPSGRLAATPLSDAASPSPGKDVKGPTAVLKSVGKIDNVEILGGIILNMRLDPAVFKDGDVSRLNGLIRTFVDEKIYHVQINVVSSDTLRAAQKEPEKYRDLTVKVAGYNAFFTQLGQPLQDSIIARTEYGL
jgi:formate C-acetyltransferase|tara:strand:- start:3414 stop:5768 length:2355 start_codon:yes stop_codon:yes gene_type:complete